MSADNVTPIRTAAAPNSTKRATADEVIGIAWWNAMTERQRLAAMVAFVARSMPMSKPQVISLNSVHHGVSESLPPPFNDVFWCVSCFCSSSHIYVTYAGTPKDLIAAGCATPEMVAPYRRGQAVRDVDGDRVNREFFKGWLRVQRTKPVALALQLPGVTIGAIRGAKARFAAVRDERLALAGRQSVPGLADYPDLSAYERPRPQLRLVVDNDSGARS